MLMPSNNDYLSDIVGEARGYEWTNNQLLRRMAEIIGVYTPGTFSFKGTWDADANDPELSDAVPASPGDFYVVTVAGTQDLGSGDISFLEGDWVVWADLNNRWNKVVASDSVVSVNGKVGAVNLDAEDVGAVTETYVLNAISTVLSSIYPVGSVYISGVNEVPAAIAAIGSWQRLENRVIIGASSTYPVDTTGGAATHTLTVNEMPSHNHEVTNTMFSGGGGSFSVSNGGGSNYDTRPIIQNRGGGQEHNNMQPYKAKYMWERTS